MAEVLRNRPLLVLAIGFLLGLSLREYPWNAVALIPLLVFVKIPDRCLALATGFAVGAVLSPRVPTSGVVRTQYLESPAVVVSIPRLYPNRLSYEVEVQGHRLTVNEPARTDRSMGDRLQMAGLVRPLLEGSEAFALSRGIVGRFQPTRIVTTVQGPSWYRSAAKLRQSFVAFTSSFMSKERATILDALCFNVEGGLTEEFESDLRATGTIHIISASGLHVFILAVVIDWLLSLLPIPRWVRLALLGGLLAFYAAAAGDHSICDYVDGGIDSLSVAP
jgi:hypothetical protein